MNIAQKIYEQARRLPEPLAREVLDFIEYIEAKHGLKDIGSEHLKEAQIPVMTSVWDNTEDEVWNEF
jgi:hypothetical protein